MRTVNRHNLSDKLSLFDITALGIGIFLYAAILSIVTAVAYQVFRYHYNIEAILPDFLIQSPLLSNVIDFIKTYSLEVSVFYLFAVSGLWPIYHATKSTFRNCTARSYQLNNNSNLKNLCFSFLLFLVQSLTDYLYLSTKYKHPDETFSMFIRKDIIDFASDWTYLPLEEASPFNSIPATLNDIFILLLSSLIVTIIMTYLWINTPLLGSRIYPERIQRNQSQ